MIWWRTLHSNIVIIFGPYNAFPNGEMEISVWVHMTSLTYLTWIVRSENDKMERSGCMLLCCEELELSSELYDIAKIVESVFVLYLQKYSIISFSSFMI